MKSRVPDRTFWKRVKDAMSAHPRYQSRATQTEAAKLAGVSQGTVSEWNCPGRGAELKNAIQLAKKLNVCVEWLYTERGPMRPPPPDDPHLRELMRLWECISDEDKGRLVNFAQVSAKTSPFSTPVPEHEQPSRAAY